MEGKRTAPKIRAMKASGEPIVCLTAYDYPSGSLAEEADVDVVLVGDSLGNVILGHDSTLPVTLDDMLRHVEAVRRAVRTPLLVADMPFGTYESGVEHAVDSAVALMKAGAEAVKLEGVHPEAIRAILNAGIPVMGHIGFTPQHIHAFGGHRVQGRGDAANALIEQAGTLDPLGVFAIVLELVPIESAQKVTEVISCPTIGIGAGPYCDGQIQVFHDVVGLTKKRYRHAGRYTDGYALFLDGLQRYVKDVRGGQFPTEDHAFADRPNS